MGSITRRIGRRTMGFCVSRLPTWCVTTICALLAPLWLAYSFTPDKGTGPLSPSRAQRHEVKPVIQNLHNVRIPTSALSPRPNPRSTSTGDTGRCDLSHGERLTDADENDAIQDWNEKANSFFEWIGMVNIGAQRHVPLLSLPCGVDRHAA
jgi:hypothetical protein